MPNLASSLASHSNQCWVIVAQGQGKTWPSNHNLFQMADNKGDLLLEYRHDWPPGERSVAQRLVNLINSRLGGKRAMLMNYERTVDFNRSQRIY